MAEITIKMTDVSTTEKTSRITEVIKATITTVEISRVIMTWKIPLTTDANKAAIEATIIEAIIIEQEVEEAIEAVVEIPTQTHVIHKELQTTLVNKPIIIDVISTGLQIKPIIQPTMHRHIKGQITIAIPATTENDYTLIISGRIARKMIKRRRRHRRKIPRTLFLLALLSMSTPS